MKSIGVIGAGGMGNNLAHISHQMGFVSGAINSSQKDLEAVDVPFKLRISGSEGVGKNRDEACTLIQNQWETAVRFVQDNFSNVDAIIVAFSSSGGTGSGISPMLLEVLTNVMPDKIFSAFVVVPDLSEATVAQVNCLKTFEELSRLNISIFPIDNQQAKLHFTAKNKIFEWTNTTAIDLLQKISSYTEKSSRNGNFDKKDFLTVLGTPGIATMSEIDIVSLNQTINLSTQWIADKLHESWIHSPFVPIETDKVTRAAVIFDGQESLMEYVDHEQIFSFFNNGKPLDLFEGNYHESKGKLYTILTGLSWCNKRLQDIEKSLDNNKDKMESVLVATPTFQSKSNVVLDKLRKPTPDKKQSVMDILNKYKR